MTTIVQEPSDSNPITEDWQKFLYRTTLQGGGFMCLMLTNINNTDESRIMKGSRFEINHTFYKTLEDEAIQPPPEGLIDYMFYYVYAVPEIQSAYFIYLSQEPTFNPILGGWFSGSMRAVARMLYINGKWYNKVILDTFDAINRQNYIGDGLPEIGGELLLSGTVNTYTQHILLPGAYRAELQAGNGGRGGSGAGNPNTMNSSTGGSGGVARAIIWNSTGLNTFNANRVDNVLLRSLFTNEPLLQYMAGSSGTPGTGGSGSNFAGGASGTSGFPSAIIIDGLINRLVLGGRGGNGGRGRNGNEMTGAAIPGNEGHVGESFSFSFFLKERRSVLLLLGGNGANGNNASGATPGTPSTSFPNTSDGRTNIYRLWGGGVAA
jgi:hypothetical protein